MLRAYAERFVRAASYMGTIEWMALCYNKSDAGGIDAEGGLQREANFGRLKQEMMSLKEECDLLGLTSTSTHVGRFLAMHTLTHETLANFMQDITLRFQEDLAEEMFVQVPVARANLYDKPLDGWEPVLDRIDCKFDVLEASMCLALERNTACVFHLMGVIQACLKVLAKSLPRAIAGVDLDTATWNMIIEKIQSAVTKKQASTKNRSAWKKKLEPFYAETIIDLKALKNAWRNPTMHFWKSATDSEARKVYDRTKDFALLIAGGPLRLKSLP